jgi:hypothetical protein
MYRKACVHLCVLTLVAIPVIAQETETAQAPPQTATSEKLVTRIFPVEYADVRDLGRVLMIFGGRVQPEPELGVIGWTGPESLLPAVEAAIASLDKAPTPEPNVELTVYFLLATKGDAAASALPPGLDGVAAQLREVFGFETVRVLETNAMQVRNGSRGELNGILPQGPGEIGEARYEFGFNRLQVTEDAAGRSIRLDMLRANVATPTKVVVDGQPTTRMMDTGIRTDIDLREGQKAVIGKTTLKGGTETVLVVVTATIVE